MKTNSNNIRCSICHDTEESTEYTRLDCNHEFHSKCIIMWFRSDNNECPLCRAQPSMILTRQEAHMRCAKVLRLANKKDAPNDLKKLALKYRKAQEGYKKVIQEYKEFMNDENKLVIKMFKDLRRKKWKAMLKLKHLKSQLGIWDLSGIAKIGWLRRRPIY